MKRAKRGMNKFPQDFPTDILPQKNNDGMTCYRGLEIDCCPCDYTDFLPTYLKEPKKFEAFCKGKLIADKQGMYSLSVYNTLENMKRALTKYKGLSKRIVAFGRGTTNSEYGIASEPRNDGHIAYFTFYADNVAETTKLASTFVKLSREANANEEQ